jgi:hypothetical protein
MFFPVLSQTGGEDDLVTVWDPFNKYALSFFLSFLLI